MSRPAPRKPRATRTRSSSAQRKRPGRASSPTSEPGGQAAYTARRRGPSPACRACAATSSGASSTSCPTRSWCRAVPARLRLLLQGRLLLGRTLLLRTADRGCPRGDRAPAREASLLPRRPPLWPPRLRRGTVRRDAGDGSALAGRGHGGRGAPARPSREGRRVRPAEPLRGLRDARRRGPARAGQATEPGEGLRGGRPPFARPRRDGERQLRVRLRRGRRLGLRSDGGVGHPAGSRNRDLPRADALPGHGAVPTDGGGPAAPAPRLSTTLATRSSARRA